MRIDYWVNALGTTRSELLSELEDLGIRVSAGARRLPKGALQRLRKKYTDPAALDRTSVTSSSDSQTKAHSPATSSDFHRRRQHDTNVITPLHHGADWSTTGD